MVPMEWNVIPGVSYDTMTHSDFKVALGFLSAGGTVYVLYQSQTQGNFTESPKDLG